MTGLCRRGCLVSVPCAQRNDSGNKVDGTQTREPRMSSLVRVDASKEVVGCDEVKSHSLPARDRLSVLSGTTACGQLPAAW